MKVNITVMIPDINGCVPKNPPKNHTVQFISTSEVITVQRLAKISIEENRAQFQTRNGTHRRCIISDIWEYLDTRRQPEFVEPDEEWQPEKMPCFKLKHIKYDPVKESEFVDLKGEEEIVRGTRAIIEYAKRRKFIVTSARDQ